MSGVLAVIETGQKISLETVAAALELGAALGLPVHVRALRVAHSAGLDRKSVV